MSTVLHALGTLGLGALAAVWRFVLVFLGGIALNAGALYLEHERLESLPHDATWWLMLGFGLLVPVAYFLAGSRLASQAALDTAYGRHRALIQAQLLRLGQHAVATAKPDARLEDALQSVTQMRDALDEFPEPVRRIVHRLLARSQRAERLVALVPPPGAKVDLGTQVGHQLSMQLDAMMRGQAAASAALVRWLFVANAVVVAALSGWLHLRG